MSNLNQELIQFVANDVHVKLPTVKKVIQLLNEGNTVPFIASYRKEVNRWTR